MLQAVSGAVADLSRRVFAMRFGDGLPGLAAGQGWTVLRGLPPGARVAVDDELGVIAVQSEATDRDVARAIAREVLRAAWGYPAEAAVERLAEALLAGPSNDPDTP